MRVRRLVGPRGKMRYSKKLHDDVHPSPVVKSKLNVSDWSHVGKEEEI